MTPGTPQAYSYTGGQQSFIVPANVVQVHAVLVGASGGRRAGQPGSPA